MASYENHDFYCILCGRRGIPLARRTGHQYSKFHRKKLYCPYCKKEVNHIECRTPEEIQEFKENFEKGVYEDEAKESLDFIRHSSIR